MIDSVFSIANTTALIGWILLIVIPRQVITKWLVHRGILFVALGLMYAVYIAIGFTESPEGGFGSLTAVKALFTSDAAVLAGWIHYLAFDLFVGGWIVRDAASRRIRHFIIILPLLFTFMLGPVGLVIYLLIRSFHSQSIDILSHAQFDQ